MAGGGWLATELGEFESMIARTLEAVSRTASDASEPADARATRIRATLSTAGRMAARHPDSTASES